MFTALRNSWQTVSTFAFVGNINPFSPSLMRSGANPVLLTTGIQFDAIASINGIGPPSICEALRKTAIFE